MGRKGERLRSNTFLSSCWIVCLQEGTRDAGVQKCERQISSPKKVSTRAQSIELLNQRIVPKLSIYLSHHLRIWGLWCTWTKLQHSFFEAIHKRLPWKNSSNLVGRNPAMHSGRDSFDPFQCVVTFCSLSSLDILRMTIEIAA